MLVVSPPHLIGKFTLCSHTLKTSRFNYVSFLIPDSVYFHLNFILIKFEGSIESFQWCFGFDTGKLNIYYYLKSSVADSSFPGVCSYLPRLSSTCALSLLM